MPLGKPRSKLRGMFQYSAPGLTLLVHGLIAGLVCGALSAASMLPMQFTDFFHTKDAKPAKFDPAP